MGEIDKQLYIDRLTDNLPMLRAKIGLTQKNLADILGVSSYTVLAIEKKQRKMTWNMFLSILLVCLSNKDVKKILCTLDIYSEELIDYIEGKR